MAKGHLISTPAKKREIRKAAHHALEVMRRNKISKNATARVFKIHPAILDRLLKGKLTYVPMSLRVELEKAKKRAECARYRVPNEKQKSIDESFVRLRLEDNRREREFLENLLKG